MLYARPAFWKAAPFVRLVLPLMAGIGAQLFFQFSVLTFALIISGIFLVCLLFYGMMPVALRFRLRWIPGICVNGLLFFFGMLLTSYHDISRRNDFSGKELTDSSYVVLKLDEPLVEKAKTWKAEATILKVINNGDAVPAEGKALLYFRKTDTLPTLRFGDRILMTNHLQEIHNSGNPGAFDYQSYCRQRQIYFQAFLQKSDWQKLPGNMATELQRFVFHSRAYCIRILERYIPGKREAGFAEALLLGYRDNLDKELLQSYTNAGVVHIIAISGLHVGLIYELLLYLLKAFPRRRWANILRFSISVLVLWLFAFVTGAQPSVLRSAVMFSAIATGTLLLRQHASIYNTLSASAFLLLCYNPFWLLDVGFQLSYIAVLSIVVFQPPLYRLVSATSRVGDFLWKIIATTLAAQVLTLPLVLYYFHQFPLIFLLSNLVAIPVSTIILYGEILLLFVHAIPVLAGLVGKITEVMIYLLDEYIYYINQLPYARWEAIFISVFQMLLLYLLIIFLSFWLLRRRKAGLVAALATGVLGLSLYVTGTIRRLPRKEMIVYNIPGFSAIDFITGDKVHFVGNKEILEDPSLVKYYLKPSHVFLRATASEEAPLNFYEQDPYLQFFDKRLLLIDTTFQEFVPSETLHVNYVILRNNAGIDMQWLKKYIRCDCVIFDGSNAFWKIEKWKNACERLNLRCFSVPDQGAFIVSL